MAYDRETFINTIEEHACCALLEFYRVKLATRNRLPRVAAGRIARIRDVLERGVVITILHDNRGFTDPRSAIKEAVKEVKRDDERFRRVAENMTSPKSKSRRLRTSVSDKDCAEFWALFDAVVEIGFQAVGPE